MSILYIMIPLAISLLGVAVFAFFWAINHRQFDDLDSPAYRVLLDDDTDEQMQKQQKQQQKRQTAMEKAEKKDTPPESSMPAAKDNHAKDNGEKPHASTNTSTTTSTSDTNQSQNQSHKNATQHDTNKKHRS